MHLQFEVCGFVVVGVGVVVVVVVVVVVGGGVVVVVVLVEVVAHVLQVCICSLRFAV